MRIRTLTLAAGIGTLLASQPAHAQLRAYAGVVAGNAAVGPQFQCATSGPSIGAPWYAGLNLPTEGMTACGLAGMVDDKTGTSGPLFASAYGTGPMASVGSFSGTAAARAGYWNLGVSANGLSTGDASTFTYRQAASYASFAQDITYTSPTVANGSSGHTNFSFMIDGLMQSLPQAPYGQQGDIAMSIFVNNQLWTAFAGTTLDNQLPYVRGASTGLPGNFVITPGQFAGSANFTTIGNFGFTWGDPLHIEIALYSSVQPCCFGASINADFYNTARLTGVDAYGPGGKVSDFIVNTSSGLQLDSQGIVQVDVPSTTMAPEPATVTLTLAGLLAIGALARRRKTVAN